MIPTSWFLLQPQPLVCVCRFGLPFVLYMDRTVTWDALQKEILEKMRHLLRPGVYVQVGEEAPALGGELCEGYVIWARLCRWGPSASGWWVLSASPTSFLRANGLCATPQSTGESELFPDPLIPG